MTYTCKKKENTLPSSKPRYTEACSLIWVLALLEELVPGSVRFPDSQLRFGVQNRIFRFVSKPLPIFNRPYRSSLMLLSV